MHFGVIVGDGVRHLFEDGGLAGFGGRDDQTALTFADGGDEVEQAGGVGVAVGFEVKAFGGEDRSQVFKGRALLGDFRRSEERRVGKECRL